MDELRSPPRHYYALRYLQHDDRWSHRPALTIPDTIKHLLQEITKSGDPVRLLDIGCGRMTVTSPIVREFQNIYALGIDWALNDIMKAYPHFESELTVIPRISLIRADFMEFRCIPRFHVAVDLGMFHHLVPHDWPKYVAQIRDILVDYGHVFLYSFHPSDQNWNSLEPGGHIRKGYYCHYHNMDSISEIFRYNVTDKGLSLSLRHCPDVMTNGPLGPVFSPSPTRC